MKTLDQMIAQMQGLLDQSQKHTTLEESIAEQAKANGVILQSLRQQLAEAGNDPTKLAQLGDLMDSLAAQQMSEDNAQASVQAALANTAQDPNTGSGDTGSAGGTDTGGADAGSQTGTGESQGSTATPSPSPAPAPAPEPSPAPAPSPAPTPTPGQ